MALLFYLFIIRPHYKLTDCYRKEKECENKCLKQLIITNKIESMYGLKAVCPICVKSRRLSRNNASHGQYTHGRTQCDKGLLFQIY